ncbi:MAG: serine hydrolase [Proteobacteria bacterium]|nr:serine hydrolase [Pseudomonadota bacterium]
MPRLLSFSLSLMMVGIVALLHPLADAQSVQPATATANKQKITPSIAKAPEAAKPAAQAASPSKSSVKKSAAGPAKTKASPTAPASAQAKSSAQASGTAKAALSKTKPQIAAGQTAPASKAAPSRRGKKARETKAATARKAAHPAPVAASAEGVQGFEKQISARSAIIMDANTGGELFAKYPDNPRQPASTIKIVTAMIALKSLKDNDVVEVSSHAASMPSSKVFLETSKQYQVNDLINAVLLASANDASVALAEKVSGSEENFANLMTLSARLWGARNTVCRTASGLTALGQQSTSRDLATLFRYAMQHDEFARRMREKTITTSYGKVLRNHNKALWRVDGALGGKTGYTVAARQTYVGQFSRDNQTIVVALMGSETIWADVGKLVEYGFKKQKDEQLAQFSHSASDGSMRTN